jgi:hypothetical protein
MLKVVAASEDDATGSGLDLDASGSLQEASRAMHKAHAAIASLRCTSERYA